MPCVVGTVEMFFAQLLLFDGLGYRYGWTVSVYSVCVLFDENVKC